MSIRRCLTLLRSAGFGVLVIVATATVGIIGAGAADMARSHESEPPGAVESQDSDYEIKTKVELRLQLEDDIHWQNLAIEVSQGDMTLNGMVRTMEEKSLATKLAATVPGVKSLKNRIIVNPELPRLQDNERAHIETTARDRVIEGQERLRDKQIMP